LRGGVVRAALLPSTCIPREAWNVPRGRWRSFGIWADNHSKGRPKEYRGPRRGPVASGKTAGGSQAIGVNQTNLTPSKRAHERHRRRASFGKSLLGSHWSPSNNHGGNAQRHSLDEIAFSARAFRGGGNVRCAFRVPREQEGGRALNRSPGSYRIACGIAIPGEPAPRALAIHPGDGPTPSSQAEGRQAEANRSPWATAARPRPAGGGEGG